MVTFELRSAEYHVLVGHARVNMPFVELGSYDELREVSVSRSLRMSIINPLKSRLT